MRQRYFLTLPESATAITASILIVGITYNLLLRELWHPVGWRRVADEALHVVMLALFALDWWLTVPKQALRVRRLAGWLLYPLGYLLYALGRGALDARYPYPFLDVTALGYPRVLLNGGAVGLAFVIVALLMLALARWAVAPGSTATARLSVTRRAHRGTLTRHAGPP